MKAYQNSAKMEEHPFILKKTWYMPYENFSIQFLLPTSLFIGTFLGSIWELQPKI